MNLRKHLFALCATATLLAATHALRAQLADTPLKSGLWETHVAATLEGRTNGDDPAVNQVCFSSGTTVSKYMTSLNKTVPGLQCNVTNKVQTAGHIAYDTACTSPNMASKSHLDFQVLDNEHFTGTSHATVKGSVNGKPMNLTVNKTFAAKFLGSSCGAVKPTIK
jgi:hypothetical protein